MIVAPLGVFLILFAIAGIGWIYKAVAVRPKERAEHEKQKGQLYGKPPPKDPGGESRPEWD